MSKEQNQLKALRRKTVVRREEIHKISEIGIIVTSQIRMVTSSKCHWYDRKSILKLLVILKIMKLEYRQEVVI